MVEREKREFWFTLIGVLIFVAAISYFFTGYGPTAYAVDERYPKAINEYYQGEAPGLQPEGRDQVNIKDPNARAAAVGQLPAGTTPRRLGVDHKEADKGDKLQHTVCQGLACVMVNGNGTNQCIDNKDCNQTNQTWYVFRTATAVNAIINNSNLTASTPLARGDQLCNLEAQHMSLCPQNCQKVPGRYVAWLSTSTTDARDRIENGRYKNIHLPINNVAESRMDLLDSKVKVPLGTAFTGGQPVWTGTYWDGTYDGMKKHYPALGPNNCNDWSTTSSSVTGHDGNGRSTSAWWTWTFGTTACDQELYLYCFQVE